MGSPLKLIARFGAIVLLSSLVSFFTCIILIDASFLYYFWLPFLAIHYLFAGIIKYIHHRADTKRGETSKFSGSFLCIVYLGFSTGVSMLFTSILISLCADPYCIQTRSTSSVPIIVWTILCIFEYFNLCLFFDLCFIKFAGTRNFLYRFVCNYPAILHTTTCVFSSFVLWLYPIFAYLSVHYFASSDMMTFSPLFLYVFLYVYSLNGLYNSLYTHWSFVNISMNAIPFNLSSNSFPIRCDANSYKINQNESDIQYEQNHNYTIRIAQLTDVHIGPLCSVERLRQICVDIVEKKPDLILLTGDFYTGEADMDGLLLKALDPLRAVSFKCFACLGNHDMETNQVCARTIYELRNLGIRLLRNESVVYDKIKRIGPIQIIGFDYMHFSDERGLRMKNIMNTNKCPSQCNHRRIVLLHDPGAFKFLDVDERVIVFSGHTHGGHAGFLTCGLKWTFLNQFLKLPDHGLWQKGHNYLYIHRGQGSRALYGNYVLRAGVPTENSLVNIQW